MPGAYIRNSVRARLVLFAGVAMTCVVFGALSTQTGAASTPAPAQYCADVAHAVVDGKAPQPPTFLGCFSSQQQAATAATNVAASSTLIGRDYGHIDFGGDSLSHYGGSGNCDSSTSYSAASMASGWNDRVRSAEGYGGCNNFVHYENSNFGGASLNCSARCSSMGVLAAQTSSEFWYHS